LETKLLEEILSNFANKQVAVLGDFFLDLYIHLDRTLSEFSLETNKEAFQATEIYGQPGAAGVVTNNIVALGAKASAIGYIGQDGYGYNLINALSNEGVDTTFLLESKERYTPTYTKPIMKEVDGVFNELNRIDIVNRTPNPPGLNDLLVDHLKQAFNSHDGILVLEQLQNDGCGVMSPLLRTALNQLTQQFPEKVVLVDSRHHVTAYRNVSIKTNLSEAIRTLDKNIDKPNHNDIDNKINIASNCLKTLWDLNHKPGFITLGEDGIRGIDQNETFYYPGFVQDGPIDIVGAGDSVLAGIGLALCSGATPKQAAYIGNLVGSIIVQKIGTTGVATPDEILQQHQAYQNQCKGN